MFSENGAMINPVAAFISALPGGYRNNNGNYNNMGNNANFWSSTENYSDGAWFRELYYYGSIIGRGSIYKDYGFSVRCVRD